jgi:hemerythrin
MHTATSRPYHIIVHIPHGPGKWSNGDKYHLRVSCKISELIITGIGVSNTSTLSFHTWRKNMALITWGEKLSVNVGEIDRQHQILITMINDLDAAMRQGKGKDILAKILSGLLDYTKSHFSLEEKYFAQFSYSDTRSHIKEHQLFVGKVAEFQKKFENGSISLSVDIINFLSDWLKKHIMGTDKKYGPFFNEKGLK